MRKSIKTEEELRKNVLAALAAERCCDGITEFVLYRHTRDELGVNWSVKLKTGDGDGLCYEAISTVVASLAKIYDLAGP